MPREGLPLVPLSEGEAQGDAGAKPGEGLPLGDTDTLCAISGAIAEAYYGEPEKHYGAVVGRLQAAGSDLYPILRRLETLDWPKADGEGSGK